MQSERDSEHLLLGTTLMGMGVTSDEHPSPSPSEKDADAAFFFARTYRSKDDVVAAVAEYNHVRRRAFKVQTSDRRRYQARCTDAACAFVVRFAFSAAFKPPTLFQPHSCAAPSAHPPAHAAPPHPESAAAAARVASHACRAKQIARYPEIRALALAHGESLKPAWIRDELARSGLRPSYANCFHARKRLLAELAADPRKFAESAGLLSLAAISATASPPSSPMDMTAASVLVDEAMKVPMTPPERSAASAAGKENTVVTTQLPNSTATRPLAAEGSPRKRQKRGESVPPPSRTLPLSPTATSTNAVTPSVVETATPPPAETPVAPLIRSEPEGCCFICPPTRVPAAEKHQILQWQVRASGTSFFDLYDDNRRIEILKSGTYRVHLYFEPQRPENPSTAASSDGSDVDDDAKYFLMVNNRPLSVFKDEMGGTTQQQQQQQQALVAREDVPVGVFNTAEVQLRKWDMLVLRRTRGAAAVASSSNAKVRTPFGRFIIELVA